MGSLSDNLLDNGGFESSGAWTTVSGTASIVDASDAAWVAPYEGARMLRMEQNAVMQSAPISVVGRTTAWVELANNSYDSSRSVTVSAVFDGDDPVVLGTVSSGGQKWVVDRFDVPVPAGASTMAVLLRANVSAVRVDDVRGGSSWL
ncbi:MAG: hypothetical protein L0L69_11555 [Propionibacterium sp.]|nr:hypothetical protein [Propionibacterium sp.]